MLTGKTVQQAAMAHVSVAMAITRLLGQYLGNFFRCTISSYDITI